jgi:hypothetical protein
MRKLALIVLLCAAVWPVGLGSGARTAEDRGIVLRVVAPRIVIRELDGTRARFVATRATVITLNGRRVRLFRLRRGDVADVLHIGRFATAIDAVRP